MSVGFCLNFGDFGVELHDGLIFGVLLDSNNQGMGSFVISSGQGGSGLFELVFLGFDSLDGKLVGSDLIVQLGGSNFQIIGSFGEIVGFDGVNDFLDGNLDLSTGDGFVEDGLELHFGFITSGGLLELVHLELVFFKGGVVGLELALFLGNPGTDVIDDGLINGFFCEEGVFEVFNGVNLGFGLGGVGGSFDGGLSGSIVCINSNGFESFVSLIEFLSFVSGFHFSLRELESDGFSDILLGSFAEFLEDLDGVVNSSVVNIINTELQLSLGFFISEVDVLFLLSGNSDIFEFLGNIVVVFFFTVLFGLGKVV